MACDGEIADEELSLVKNLATKTDFFGNLDVETLLNKFLAELKEQGSGFVSGYLRSIVNAQLTKEQELLVCQVAIKTILADKQIEYNEIAFFKKIRAKLNVSDDDILSDENIQNEFSTADQSVLQGQTLQSFLLPDIIDDSIFDWSFTLDKIELRKVDVN